MAYLQDMGLDALSLKSTPSSPDKSAGTPPAFWLFELMGFKTSGIRQQGGPLTAEMMGDPGLLQEGPDVSTLLPEGGDDREQTAAAQGSLGGLNAMADRAVDHRLPQRSYFGPPEKGKSTAGQLVSTIERR